MTLDFGALHGEGVATASDTIYPKTKPKVRAKGQAKVRARRKPERRLVIRDKKQAIQYSNIIIVALQEALD